MDDMGIRQDANGNYVITLPRDQMRDLLYLMNKGLSQITNDKIEQLQAQRAALTSGDNDSRLIAQRNYNVYDKIDKRVRPVAEVIRKRFSVLDYASRH